MPCLNEARRVDQGDIVALHDRPLQTPQPQDVQILFLDPHVVVVEKPSGMMTHRRPEERAWSEDKKARQPSLEEAVAHLIARRSLANAPKKRRRTFAFLCCESSIVWTEIPAACWSWPGRPKRKNI